MIYITCIAIWGSYKSGIGTAFQASQPLHQLISIMSNSNLSALSMTELKAIALELGAVPTNDKRSKQSWIAIITLTREVAAIRQADPQTSEEADTLHSIYEGKSELLGEILLNPEDTLTPDDDDTWELVEMPSHAEQEAIAAAVDVAQHLTPNPHKKGATSVFASLLCVVIFAITMFCRVAIVAIKIVVYFAALFGEYDPALDISYQLQCRVAERNSKHSAPSHSTLPTSTRLVQV